DDPSGRFMSRLADMLSGVDRGPSRRHEVGGIPGLAPAEVPRGRWRVLLTLAIVVGMAVLAATVLFWSPGEKPVTPVTAPVPARPAPLAKTAAVSDLVQQGREAANHGSAVEAALLFKQALAANDLDAETWNSLGVVLVRQGESGEGIDAFRRAVKLMPAHAEANRNLAVALDRRGKTAEAVTYYRAFLGKAPERHPDRADVHRRLVELGGR
ncbi:MAG TPA: tetratricopeptide repeat protein, partial [Candidatus Limnocylindrales bacterium]|nr:tetratricopeptide repeat protein [Candidatus Limnocylindrales bacterium]